MARIAFVTGGTGFIGSHLVEELIDRGYREVRCLVRTQPRWLEGLDIVPVRGNIEDTSLLCRALKGVDEVYHVAGVTRATRWEVLKRGNIDATLSLLYAVHSSGSAIRKVVVLSSLARVGRAETSVVDEQAPLLPLTRYGRSKAMMEKVLAEPDQSGVCFRDALPLVIVRPPVVYGPRDVDVFAFFKMLNRGFCPVVGKGREQLSLVYVRDLVRGILMAAASDKTNGQTYFIGDDNAVSWQQLKEVTTMIVQRRAWTIPIPRFLVRSVAAFVEGAGRMVGSYPPLNREKAREILYAAKMCTSARAYRDFGYEPEVSLSEGVCETMAWYRAKGWL